jgi:hypothetical protein
VGAGVASGAVSSAFAGVAVGSGAGAGAGLRALAFFLATLLFGAFLALLCSRLVLFLGMCQLSAGQFYLSKSSPKYEERIHSIPILTHKGTASPRLSLHPSIEKVQRSLRPWFAVRGAPWSSRKGSAGRQRSGRHPTLSSGRSRLNADLHLSGKEVLRPGLQATRRCSGATVATLARRRAS